MALRRPLAIRHRDAERGAVTHVDPLAEAKRLLSLDPARAARIAEAVGATAGADTAKLLLATARRRAGEVEGAAAVISPLAVRLPAAWGVQFEYGMTLSAAGDAVGALEALRRARAAKPDAALATHALWDIAIVTGAPEARSRRPRIAALSAPAVVTAAIDFFRGDEAARRKLADQYGFDPNDAAAACLLAEIGATEGFDGAVARLMQAAVLRAPRHGPARYRLAGALHAQGADAEALAAFVALPAEIDRSAEMLVLRGSILMAQNRVDEAVDDLSRAEYLAPDDAGIHLRFGHMLRASGQHDRAVSAYREAILRQPALGEAYWSLADLKTNSLTAEDVEDMEQLLDRHDLDVRPRSHVAFALGHALEGAGRYREAFARYREGNRLRRSVEPFDIIAQESFVARTLALCDANFLPGRMDGGHPAGDPIFVVGMPRAGSSLVEQILASHSAIESASELPDLTQVARSVAAERPYPDVLAQLTPAEFTAAGRDYLARAQSRRRTARPRFIDKFPGNVLHLPLIHLALPNARIIDVRRDPLDCCVSLFSQSFARGQAYSYDLGHLGRYYATYVRLAAAIDGVLPGLVLRVRYEDLVDDLEGQTRRMLDYLGLPFEPGCLRFHAREGAVRTASSEQVRRPIYRQAIGRWRRFSDELAPLVDALRAGGVTVAEE